MSSLIYALQGGFGDLRSHPEVERERPNLVLPPTFNFCPSSLVVLEPQLNLAEGKRAGGSLVKEGLSSLAPREEPLF